MKRPFFPSASIFSCAESASVARRRRSGHTPQKERVHGNTRSVYKMYITRVLQDPSQIGAGNDGRSPKIGHFESNDSINKTLWKQKTNDFSSLLAKKPESTENKLCLKTVAKHGFFKFVLNVIARARASAAPPPPPPTRMVNFVPERKTSGERIQVIVLRLQT